jgi:hypothetical protein
VNIGNPNEFTILECAREVLDVTGSKSKISFAPLPQDDPKQRRLISEGKAYPGLGTGHPAPPAAEVVIGLFAPSGTLPTGKLQFEADIRATGIGNISNFIFVTEPSLVSPVFGMPGTKNAAKFTIIPAAIEVGTNLQNPDNPALDGHSVGRLKSGAVPASTSCAEKGLFGSVSAKFLAAPNSLLLIASRMPENVFRPASKKSF